MLEHEAAGRRLHLFVKQDSHDGAVYLGVVVVVRGSAGSGPMSVTFGLSREVPEEIDAELRV